MKIVKIIKTIINYYQGKKRWDEIANEDLKVFKPSEDEMARMKEKGII